MRHRRHVFVCVQRRDGGGKPACGDRGGSELLARIDALLVRDPAARTVATGTLCLGPCFDGPNAVVYPEGEWSCGLSAADAEAVLAGTVGGDLRHPWTDEGED